jgi:hypothetical protein
MNSEQIAAFRHHGFFIVPAFLHRDEVSELRASCDAALGRERTRSIETGASTPRISLVDVEAAFAFFGSSRVTRLLLGLQSPTEADLPRLTDVHYYHEQVRRDWDGDWHRDSQFLRAVQTDLEAEPAIVRSSTAVHVRVAFEQDDRLEIVPGSHARSDTPEELRIRRGSNRASGEMPNATRIGLAAGDACVFHAYSVHRATYRRAPPRRTLDALYKFVPQW